MKTNQYIVSVGSPFEQQSFYGPFSDFETASEFADSVDEQTWIVSLLNPETQN
jgi:hypothetical protein